MQVFINGRFVPEEKAAISIFDRGFLYGDGLFEAVRVHNGKLFRWAEHIRRFWTGAEYLNIHPPLSPRETERAAMRLIEKNHMPDALLRLTLSRGVGARGYSPAGAETPTFVITLHAAPVMKSGRRPVWKVITASHRLPADEPLALFKNANKLPQILARAEADAARADEAILLNTDGKAVEGTTSNLFWVKGNTVCTPQLAAGILPGVTRSVVLEICRALKISTKERAPRPADLRASDGVFFSMTSWGVMEAGELDGRKLRRARCVKIIQRCYQKMLNSETR